MRDGTASTAHPARPFELAGCVGLPEILAPRDHVRQSFLIPRQLREHLSILVHLAA